MKVYVVVCIVHLREEEYPEVLGVYETPDRATMRIRDDVRSNHRGAHSEHTVAEVDVEG